MLTYNIPISWSNHSLLCPTGFCQPDCHILHHDELTRLFVYSIPLLACYALAQNASTTSSSQKEYPNDGEVNDIYGWNRTGENPWVPGPDSRGTWDIALSCLATLLLCTWTAIHTVVPPDLGWAQGMFNKLWWVFVGICWPEYLFGCAYKEFWEVRKLRNMLRELQESKPQQTPSPAPGESKEIGPSAVTVTVSPDDTVSLSGKYRTIQSPTS